MVPAMKTIAQKTLLAISTSLMLIGCAGIGDSSTKSDSEAAPTSNVDHAEAFESTLAGYSDYKMIDTTLTLSGKELRVLAADGILKPEQLKEDIGFDQIEGKLLVLTNGSELFRETFSWDWGAKVLKRDALSFSPVGNLKFVGVENEKLLFRLMLIEYDMNKMYYLDYTLDAEGSVGENLREA